MAFENEGKDRKMIKMTKADKLVSNIRERVPELTQDEEDEIREATRTGRQIVLRASNMGRSIYFGRRQLVEIRMPR